jgi:excisionase family DNA binding protein
MGQGRLMTTADVADTFGVSVHTVRRLVRGGVLAKVKIGGSTRFRPEDVEALIESRLSQEKGPAGRRGRVSLPARRDRHVAE